MKYYAFYAKICLLFVSPKQKSDELLILGNESQALRRKSLAVYLWNGIIIFCFIEYLVFYLHRLLKLLFYSINIWYNGGINNGGIWYYVRF